MSYRRKPYLKDNPSLDYTLGHICYHIIFTQYHKSDIQPKWKEREKMKKLLEFIIIIISQDSRKVEKLKR